MNEKLVFDFFEQCDGGRALLGGKGLGLAEMRSWSASARRFHRHHGCVPAYLEARSGLTPELRAEIEEHLAELERRTGLRLGDPAKPLSSPSALAARSRCRG